MKALNRPVRGAAYTLFCHRVSALIDAGFDVDTAEALATAGYDVIGAVDVNTLRLEPVE